MEHTQVPWESTGSIVRRAAGTFVPIADTYVSIKTYNPSIETREANAEFIVRACNSFDDLLAALQMIVAVSDDDPSASPVEIVTAIDWDMIEKALAKAM